MTGTPAEPESGPEREQVRGAEPGPPEPAPDFWKGFRGVVAAILVLEALSVLFCLMVVTKIDGTGGAVGVVLVLGLALALVVTTRLLARSWGLRLVAALQVAVIVSGLIVPVLTALGVIFGVVWAVVWYMRRDVARRMALGELPSQRR